MRRPLQAIAILLVGAASLATLAVSARPLDSTPRNLPPLSPQQQMGGSVCASSKPPNGAGKFTGRIQSAPAGTSFEVNSGKETAVITLTGSTTICQGGQSVSAEALVPGLTLTVYGEMNRVANTYRMAAALILLEGRAALAPRTTSNPPKTNPSTNSGSAPPNDPSPNMNPAQNTPNPASPPQNSSDSTARLQTGSGDLNKQNSQGRGGSTISCESMRFNIPGGAGGPGLGRAPGRLQVDGITCIRPVDQQSMQLVDDGTKGERMATVTLTWQNVIVATLTNAFVSSVQFTSSGSQPVAEIAFNFTRIELQSGAGGVRISLEGKP